MSILERTNDLPLDREVAIQNNLNKIRDSLWPLEKPDVDIDVHNWFDAKSVMNHILTDKIRYYCELGCWTGISFLYACNKLPKETMLFAVDIWPSNSDEFEKYCDKKYIDQLKNHLPALYESFLVNCWDHKEKIIPLKMLTIEGLEKIHSLNVPLDMIYIDGCHYYEYVKNDIETSLRLFPDAVIYGDDYNWPGVGRAVIEIAKLHSFEVFVCSNLTWIYNRNLEKIGLTKPPSGMVKMLFVDNI